MLRSLNEKDFDKVYKIMSDSFPTDEMRPYSEQRALLDNEIYRLYGAFGEGDELKAFAAVYEFDNVIFLEHLAVSAVFRNQGLGGVMLRELMKKGKTICLEVELPLTDMARRRIGFYERNGFFYNDGKYIQPPLSRGQDPIELKLMTSGHLLAPQEFEKMKDLIYTKAYKCDMSAF